jgi:hypothetical protein
MLYLRVSVIALVAPVVYASVRGEYGGVFSFRGQAAIGVTVAVALVAEVSVVALSRRTRRRTRRRPASER